MAPAVATTSLPGLPPPRRGKVRDVYDLGDQLLIVCCDRISAYDHVLSPAIPGKGQILHQLSSWWFTQLASVVPNHVLATDVEDFPSWLTPHQAVLRGRSALVRRAEVIPFECVARGYLAGSAWSSYRESGSICGVSLPSGLERAARLAQPIFTPATKAEAGHDENVAFDHLVAALGSALAERLRDLTLELYRRGAELAEQAGLLLVDTKFEFGHCGGELTLVDEILTPDSSRYWDAASWKTSAGAAGREPVSFDKQPVRDWLDGSGWDHHSTPPVLPDEVVAATLDRYRTAFVRLVGHEPQVG